MSSPEKEHQYQRRYRERHREEILARQRARYDPKVRHAYFIKTREKHREWVRQWRAKRRDYVNEKARARYAQDPEYHRRQAREWRRKNIDKERERCRKAAEKGRKSLSDYYVLSQIVKDIGGTIRIGSGISKEFVELYRQAIILRRMLRNK